MSAFKRINCVLLHGDVVLKEKAVPTSPKSHRSAVQSGRARQRKVSIAVLIVLLYLTDGTSYCTAAVATNCIAAVFDSLVIFTSWFPYTPCLIHGYFRPPKSTLQMASRLAHPFLRSSQVWPTCRETMTSVAIAHICALNACCANCGIKTFLLYIHTCTPWSIKNVPLLFFR